MEQRNIRWGILGLGKIANKFAQDLQIAEDAVLAGVASRNLEKAKEFALTHNSERFYGEYNSLVEDETIDVIYIATPHVFHFENTLFCLRHGKAVLCEKPFAINSFEVQKMIRLAREKKLFLMEAMWTRFIPGIEKVIELINSGIIGQITKLEANFGFIGDTSPDGRLYNRDLGGGALLDIGIYPVYLSLLLLGKPDRIEAEGIIQDNVDLSCKIQFTYPGNIKAHLECTFLENTSTDAVVHGTKGKILIHRRFHHPTRIDVETEDGVDQLTVPYEGNGYYHEIIEVNKMLLDEQEESSKMTLNNSKDLITTLDEIREKLGVTYPSDNNRES